MPMRLPFRRRTNSSPNQQTRPPPGPPRPIGRKSGHFQRASTSQPLSSSPHLSSSFEFNDARQRWGELARDRRSGLSLSLASDDFDNAAASIDSINLSDQPQLGQAGVRHVCTPPILIDGCTSAAAALLAPSAATSESVASNSSGVPSTHPSPTSYSRNMSRNASAQHQHQHHHQPHYPTTPYQQQQQYLGSNSHNSNTGNTHLNVDANTNTSNSTPSCSPTGGRPIFGDASPNPISFRVDYAELTALKQKFNQLDAEGKGFLSRSQFYELFSSLMDSSQHDPHHTPMFNFAYSLFHSAGDRLNLREFVTGMSVLSKGSEEERLRYLFMMYDEDSSGNLNGKELKQVFRIMGNYAASHDFRASDSLDSQSLSSLRTIDPSTFDDLVEKTIKNYDLDGDGTIGFDDFVKWCQSDPVVKTWMDMLCYDTARGVAKLRGESEKILIARELEGLGIGENEFWRDSFNLQNNSNTPLSAPTFVTGGNGNGGGGSHSSASTSFLPPTLSSASQPNVSMGIPERSDSSGEYEGDNGRKKRYTRVGAGTNAGFSPRIINSGIPNQLNAHNNRNDAPGESVDAMSGDYVISSSDVERQSNSTTPQVSMTDSAAIGSFEIDFKDLVFEKQIGSGSFAVVWKCKWLDSPVGVKVFKSGPRLLLNSDGTPVVTPPPSQTALSSSASHGTDAENNTNINNNNNHQHDGFVENGESFEPEFDSMMSAVRNDVNRSLYDEEGGMESAKNQSRFLQEVLLLKSIRHPNLLLYMGACVDVNYPLCIVSELIDGGSLFELLHGRDKAKLDTRQKLILTQDIARGMLYLHGRDPIVLHRDLKSANILVEQQNDDSFKGTIIDFGLSKLASTQASIVPGRGRGLTGSLVTMAPEIMNEQNYEPRSDVYSYAIVCWEIWCGRVPFGKITNPAQLLMKVAIQGGRPEFETQDAVPTAIQKLIRACWDQDVRKRPDFLMIVKTLNEIRHDLKVDVDTH